MKKRLQLVVAILSLSAAFVVLFWLFRSPYRIERGKLGEALFEYALPREWDGQKLLLIAQGHVAEENPLSAEFSRSSRGYGLLLEQGWLVAKTSYRRNGPVIEEGIEDIRALLHYIESEEGVAEIKIVEGSSMGGLNSILMLEGDHPEFDGALVVGPAIYLEYPDFKRSLSERLKRPLLMVANQTEYDRPLRYYQKASEHGSPVALWKISRNGHVNINADERNAAINGLVHWIETGEIDSFQDATVYLEPDHSSALKQGDSLVVEVSGVDKTHGNLVLDLIERDLNGIGLKRGDVFTIKRGEHQFECLWGDTFGDVRVGDWVLFNTAYGQFLLAENMGNAYQRLGKVKKGKTLQIQSFQE